MLILKKGVDARSLHPQILLAIQVATEVYKEYSVDCVITSICDGRHGKHSLHAFGYAVDIRTRNIALEDSKQEIRDKIAIYLGNQYDVLLERGVAEHIHIEWDVR